MSDVQHWYEADSSLMRAEIEAMRQLCPDATHDFLPDGRMCWSIPVVVDFMGTRKRWLVLAVYREDHPSTRFGGSIDFYPLSPSFEEMRRMVDDAGIERTVIPHTYRDGAGRVCLSLETLEHSRATNRGTIASAASYIEQLKLWITSFELGLLDKDSWETWAGRRC